MKFIMRKKPTVTVLEMLENSKDEEGNKVAGYVKYARENGAVGVMPYDMFMEFYQPFPVQIEGD